MKGVVNPTDGGGTQPRPLIAPLVHASVLQQLLVEGVQVFACEFQQGLWVVNPGSVGSLARPTYAVAILAQDGAVCYLNAV